MKGWDVRFRGRIVSERPAKTNAERKGKRDRERKRMGLVSRARKSAKLYEPTTIFATTRLQRGCFTRRDAPRQTPSFQNDASLRYETREKRSRLSAMQISLRHRSYIVASMMHPRAVTRWSTASCDQIRHPRGLIAQQDTLDFKQTKLLFKKIKAENAVQIYCGL